jgi:SSS family solute:Na+ symporter
MFWKRTTGHAAFWGLIAGTVTAALIYGLTVAEGKGGWISNFHEFYSGTGQAFTIAWISFVACFVVTTLISLITRPKPYEQLIGLVYSMTPRQTDKHKLWYKNPLWLGILVLLVTIILNIIFF